MTTTATTTTSGPAVRYLVLGLAAAIAFALLPYVPGLLGAVILYVSTAMVHRRLARTVGARAAASIVIVGVSLLLLLPGVWLASTAVEQAAALLDDAARGDYVGRLSRLRIGPIEVAPDLVSLSTSLFSWFSGRALTLFGSATRATLNLIIALFGLYYLLLEQRDLWGWFCRLLHLESTVAERLRTRFREVTEAMLIGTLLTAVLQGVLVGGAFTLLGLRGGVLWGLVTACVSVLPVFGAALVWLPGVAALALDERYGAAMILAVIGGVIASNIDNVVRLGVYRRVSGIHPMITLVGGFAGVGIFGILGVLLGPLALSYFFELLHIYESTVPAAPVVAAAPVIDARPVGESADSLRTVVS